MASFRLPKAQSECLQLYWPPSPHWPELLLNFSQLLKPFRGTEVASRRAPSPMTLKWCHNCLANCNGRLDRLNYGSKGPAYSELLGHKHQHCVQFLPFLVVFLPAPLSPRYKCLLCGSRGRQRPTQDLPNPFDLPTIQHKHEAPLLCTRSYFSNASVLRCFSCGQCTRTPTNSRRFLLTPNSTGTCPNCLDIHLH